MNSALALCAGAGLLGANAFFVTAEFAMVTAARHRLQVRAQAGDAPARAALAATRRLPVVLAGAQLGITLSSLGIGALAEPALAHLLEPLVRDLRLPDRAGHALAFLIGLGVVVFAHLVVGEMVPKSLALAAPEASARRLARPFTAFMAVFRWPIAGLSALANLVLRAVGVTAGESRDGPQDLAELRSLIVESGRLGLIEPSQHDLLLRVARAQSAPASALADRLDVMASVTESASIREIGERLRETGAQRIVVLDGQGRALGLVHARDVVLAGVSTAVVAADLVTGVPVIPSEASAATAVLVLQRARSALGVLVDDAGRVTASVRFSALLAEVLGLVD